MFPDCSEPRILYSDLTSSTSDSMSFKEIQTQQKIVLFVKKGYKRHILHSDIQLLYRLTELIP